MALCDQGDQPSRDLLLQGYPHVLSDDGLLSVLVGESGIQQVRGLLGDDVRDGLWHLCGDDLVTLEGVGPATAARLLAAVEMGRRMRSTSSNRRMTVTTPEDVAGVCEPRLRGLDREHFLALALNSKNRLLRVIEISIGSLNASIVHPRELFKGAVRLSAASIIAVHNHPSGDPTPSGADISLTRRIVKAGDVLGIDVLDHVIIGTDGQHASLRDLGLM
ncbi:MAG: DNA repair protein RadC [Coriobacteriia bacterium]|nr:DNA repair protein RadC [Coriobacteriia bacterium]